MYPRGNPYYLVNDCYGQENSLQSMYRKLLYYHTLMSSDQVTQQLESRNLTLPRDRTHTLRRDSKLPPIEELQPQKELV